MNPFNQPLNNFERRVLQQLIIEAQAALNSCVIGNSHRTQVRVEPIEPASDGSLQYRLVVDDDMCWENQPQVRIVSYVQAIGERIYVEAVHFELLSRACAEAPTKSSATSFSNSS